jgi:actin-related protein
MLSTGRLSGLVVDIGYKSTRAAVFCDSKIVDKSVVSVPIGGYHVTEKLKKLFFAKGVNFSTAA